MPDDSSPSDKPKEKLVSNPSNVTDVSCKNLSECSPPGSGTCYAGVKVVKSPVECPTMTDVPVKVLKEETALTEITGEMTVDSSLIHPNLEGVNESSEEPKSAGANTSHSGKIVVEPEEVVLGSVPNGSIAAPIGMSECSKRSDVKKRSEEYGVKAIGSAMKKMNSSTRGYDVGLKSIKVKESGIKTTNEEEPS